MEAEAAVALPDNSLSPPCDDDHPDFSPVGSPDLTDAHFPQPPPDRPPPPPLSGDLRDNIIKQVEYYFSNENLVTDKFLMKYVTKDKEGYVPIGVIASFKKMKKLSKDTSVIVSALRESSLLVVSASGKNVRRLHPLPFSEAKDPMLCTVLVENLPEDHSVENIRRVFSKAGNIKNVVIRDPHCTKEPRKVTIAEKLLSGKLHALVEYDTVEAAEKAVAILNNEQDWRYGLRVKLLKKKTKAESKKKVWREAEAEKHSSVQASCLTVNEEIQENLYLSEHHDDSHGEEDGEHLIKDKNGDHLPKEKNEEHLHTNAHKNPRRGGRGRRQKHHGTNGQGHGSLSSSPASSHALEHSKPPPGPRMPDGTKGFTMGRGRPLASNAI